MGVFAVKFILKHPAQPHQQVELEGLVDTGALFTQVPAEVIAGIGITPSGTRAVYYADGNKDMVPVAKADIAIDGTETATMVLCGKPNSLILIGATTLETLGLGVDPVHKRLIPIEAPMASCMTKINLFESQSHSLVLSRGRGISAECPAGRAGTAPRSAG
jgi:clan AA aspartic protease